MTKNLEHKVNTVRIVKIKNLILDFRILISKLFKMFVKDKNLSIEVHASHNKIKQTCSSYKNSLEEYNLTKKGNRNKLINCDR